MLFGADALAEEIKRRGEKKGCGGGWKKKHTSKSKNIVLFAFPLQRMNNKNTRTSGLLPLVVSRISLQTHYSCNRIRTSSARAVRRRLGRRPILLSLSSTHVDGLNAHGGFD